MKTFISILSAKTNNYSNEKVVVGLIAVTPNQIYFDFSNQKISYFTKFIQSQQPAKLLKQVLEQLKASVSTQNSSFETSSLNLSNGSFTENYFSYLNKYNNGVLHFSETIEIPKTFTSNNFKSYFKNFVGVDLVTKAKVKNQSIHKKVKTYFKKAGLKEKADVDFSLNPINFKGILKSTTVPLITKNGAVNAIQIIDFKTQPASITNHLYETKIIQESLLKFLKPKKVTLNKIQIAFDEPALNSIQHSIFDMAYSEYKSVFDFIETEKVDEITNEILDSSNTKFSELI